MSKIIDIVHIDQLCPPHTSATLIGCTAAEINMILRRNPELNPLELWKCDMIVKLIDVLEPQILKGYTNFFTTTEPGFDLLAAKVIGIMRTKYKQVRLFLFPSDEGTEEHISHDKEYAEEHKFALSIADFVVTGINFPRYNFNMGRLFMMVNKSDLIMGYLSNDIIKEEIIRIGELRQVSTGFDFIDLTYKLK